jgi:hypothetical protein
MNKKCRRRIAAPGGEVQINWRRLFVVAGAAPGNA